MPWSFSDKRVLGTLAKWSLTATVVGTMGLSAACSSALSQTVKDSEVSIMSPQYAQPIEAARTAVRNAEVVLQQAKAKAKLAEAEAARAAYLEAVLDEREAEVEMGEAEVWVMRARLELVKLEQLRAAKGQSGVSERLIKFKEQLAERETKYLGMQKDHASSKLDREKARAKLNQALRTAGLQQVANPDDTPKATVKRIRVRGTHEAMDIPAATTTPDPVDAPSPPSAPPVKPAPGPRPVVVPAKGANTTSTPVPTPARPSTPSTEPVEPAKTDGEPAKP